MSSVPLQQSLRDADTAYKNCFASVSGKRKGRKVGPPRFKKRSHRQAARFTRNAGFRVLDDGRLRLPKIGDLKVAWSRELPAAPSSVSLIKEPSGKYFVSFVVIALVWKRFLKRGPLEWAMWAATKPAKFVKQDFTSQGKRTGSDLGGQSRSSVCFAA